MLERLDYPKPIYLEVTSEVERRLRMTACAKEKETVTFIESLEPGCFFDIGANVGSYSFVAAVNGHKVFSFEPPGPTFDRLETNLIGEFNAYNALAIYGTAILLEQNDARVKATMKTLDAAAKASGSTYEDARQKDFSIKDRGAA